MFEPGSYERPDQELAVVIGAGGLSSAVARRLSQQFRVLVADIDGGLAEALAAQLRGEGADAAHIACDVTVASSVDRLAESAKTLGGMRVLAQVAGLSPSFGDFARIVEVNLVGPALLERAFLPQVRRCSVAIFTSSMAAHCFAPGPAVWKELRDPLAPDLPGRLMAASDATPTPAFGYQASKAGLLWLCRRRAHAWGRRGGRILSISPGLIATPMGAAEFARSPTKRGLYDQSPLGREGSVQEVAALFGFFASNDASFVSGTDVLVDGGLSGCLSASEETVCA